MIVCLPCLACMLRSQAALLTCGGRSPTTSLSHSVRRSLLQSLLAVRWLLCGRRIPAETALLPFSPSLPLSSPPRPLAYQSSSPTSTSGRSQQAMISHSPRLSFLQQNKLTHTIPTDPPASETWRQSTPSTRSTPRPRATSKARGSCTREWLLFGETCAGLGWAGPAGWSKKGAFEG